MTALGRPCSVANLDPANDNVPYAEDAAFDVRDLVNVDEVMEREDLGPNGGVLWAMEEIEANFDWLEQQLENCGTLCCWNPRCRSLADNFAEETVVLDPPGQPELTIHHMALPRILHRLEKLGYRVCLLFARPINAAD